MCTCIIQSAPLNGTSSLHLVMRHVVNGSGVHRYEIGGTTSMCIDDAVFLAIVMACQKAGSLRSVQGEDLLITEKI